MFVCVRLVLLSYLASSSRMNQRQPLVCVVPARKDMFNMRGRQTAAYINQTLRVGVAGEGLGGLAKK